MTTVGVVGLGVMGRALSRRLLAAGHEVHGHDVGEEAARQAAALGVVLEGPDRLAELDVVLTSLPDDAAVAAALLPPDVWRPGCGRARRSWSSAPDDPTAAGIALAVAAGGAVRAARTTRLLSGPEWVESLRKATAQPALMSRPAVRPPAPSAP